MSATPAVRPQRNYLLLTALAVTLVIVLLLLLAEGGVRLRQWVKHGQASSVDALLRLDPASGLHVPRPGVHSGKIHINSQGFRGAELSAVKPALRVAFLGASTTFCAEVSQDAAPGRSWWTRSCGQRIRRCRWMQSMRGCRVTWWIPRWKTGSSGCNRSSPMSW